MMRRCRGYNGAQFEDPAARAVARSGSIWPRVFGVIVATAGVGEKVRGWSCREDACDEVGGVNGGWGFVGGRFRAVKEVHLDLQLRDGS